MPYLSLRVRLFGAFVVILTPVLLLLLVSFRQDTERRQAEVLSNQLLTAQAIAAQVDETFGAAIGIGWAVANDPLTATMAPDILDPHLRSLVAAHPEYDAVNVFDASGANRGWGHLSEPAEPRLDIADRPYFQQVMATNSPVVSETILLRRPNVIGVIACVPVRGLGGEPIGVVNVVMRTDHLARHYQEARLQAGQTILLADPTGRLAFATSRPNLMFEESDNYSDLGALRTALAGTPATLPLFTSPLDGGERMGAFAPTPDFGWAVGVTVPRSVALAPVEAVLRQQLIAFVAILTFSFLLALLLARYMLSPVRRLSGAVAAFGRGDLRARASVKTGDEIQRLGEAFNQMADQIERRQVEVLDLKAQAEQRSRQLAAVIASMADSVIVVNADGQIVDANPAALTLVEEGGRPALGVPVAEFLARYQARHLDGRPVTMDEAPVSRALAGETFTSQPLRIRLPDGRERIIRSSGSPVRDESGRVVLGVVVSRDVTDEWRREQEQEAIARIGQALVSELELERVADVVLEQSQRVLGADTVALWLADAAHQELHLLASRNLSPASADVIRDMPYDAPFVAARAARTEQMQVVDDLRRLRLPAPASTLYEREGLRGLLVVPLHSRGRLVGVVGCGTRTPSRPSPRDLAFNSTVSDLFAVAVENARLYNEVRDALRLREEFLASAAHELKTPVTIIKGWVDLLARRRDREPQEMRMLEGINRQTFRVAHLIEDLLSVVRLGPRPVELSLEQFDLAGLVEEAASEAARQADQHPVEIDAAGPLPVCADRRLIDEVVTHLIENARTYSPKGGRIRVVARRSDSEAIVSITDQGVGIAPERQPHVFEPFFEPVPSGKAGYVGTVSLALHLSKRVIEAHGGRIWLKSAPQEGSRFSFSLPLDTDSRPLDAK